MCEMTGLPIREAVASNFMHVLGKGAYPGLKLDPRNVILVKEEIHQIWDNGQWKAREDPQFEWLFIYEQFLKEEYHAKRKLYALKKRFEES